MRDVAVIGVGAHAAGKFSDKALKDLGREALWRAFQDAGVGPKNIQVAYFGNSLGGLLTGQEGIRGQVVLQESGVGGIPVINVENACASAATAFRGAWLEVASGALDMAVALGVEKMFVGDVAKSISALAADSELELSQMGMQFTASYAVHPKINLKGKMKEYGWTTSDFAKVVVKNSYNGSLNPYAQHRRRLSVEDVLNSRMVADPLTLYMCSSIADGAAAAVLCPLELAQRFTDKPLITVAACVLRSGIYRLPGDSMPDSLTLTAAEAYERAGIGPEDVDLAEVHDAMAPAELMVYERLGFCEPGEGPRLIDDGVTGLGGQRPVNPSGGLCARGHPVGATGLMQIAELVWQLRGEAGERQVQKSPKVAMAQNQGGLLLGQDSAAYAVTLLKH
ncbi:MAG: thiolase family protein [Gammaproteobacteria bacterium]|nr:thiolase family protein [Gammaproteobacteria bacterium]NIR85921.1 thiolase family protein [Gammaproteobacteria bacterium]NIR91913.1 thiolase family protein [Gammaproteobacteria bacterium]NIU07170.1 thiolase family protein [Gammaproteobacteria bacterium]NIV53983.1 thiolase family protein [Gammaproteobacteria bacterium]